MKSLQAIKIFLERFKNGFSYRYFNFEDVNQKKVAKIMMRSKEYRVMWVTKHIYLVGLY